MEKRRTTNASKSLKRTAPDLTIHHQQLRDGNTRLGESLSTVKNSCFQLAYFCCTYLQVGFETQNAYVKFFGQVDYAAVAAEEQERRSRF
jgi:hypothetical protein